MSSVTEYLFNSIYNVLKQKQKLTDDLLNDLYGLFGDQLCDALALLDNAQEHLAKLCSPCELNIWRVKCVKKKKETFVYCLPNGNYCSCPDFAIDVLKADKLLWCNHLLAVKLAIPLGKHSNEEISEQKYLEIRRRLGF